MSRGSVNEKLQWVFNLYDLNGDGLITKAEMVDVVSSIYEMLGRATQPAVDDSSAKEHVEKIFNVSNLAQLPSLAVSPSICRDVLTDFFFSFRFET